MKVQTNVYDALTVYYAVNRVAKIIIGNTQMACDAWTATQWREICLAVGKSKDEINQLRECGSDLWNWSQGSIYFLSNGEDY